MPAFDSIVNVEEWISDHYLTTDETRGASFSKRVAQRIKYWKNEEESTGYISPLVRFTAARQDIQSSLAVLNTEERDVSNDHEQAVSASKIIRTALGYGDLDWQNAQHGNDSITYRGWSGNAGSVQVLEAEPISSAEEITSSALLSTVEIRGNQELLSASELIGRLFLSDHAPAYVVCIAGSWVILAERETWPLGRYLAIDIGLVVERNDTKSKGEVQQAVVSLARENTERAADGTTWWDETIEQSRQHAVQVSGELRGAVRESIEIIGNDILNRRRALGLSIDDIDGAELAKQALRYLYRILFLLFAEASPELEILPTGSPEYDEGYGLARLRELVLDPPTTHAARQGTHLYDSLQLLFTLIDKGHNPVNESTEEFDSDAGEPGLYFRNLSADLFLPRATSLIDEVKLSNEALNQVLENLLLSKVKKGKDRGFISYATLGVTELGQVYEGLMSFTGFIAKEDLYEVAPEGKADKGSWMLPVSRANDVPQDSFVMQEVEADGGFKKVRRRHPRGSFVFRQSSRDRERSASFYTPQVLTKFTVGQAIDVLKESGRISTAQDILTLTICEPAMGSGAFAVETVRQLAELYLQMRQDELKEQINAEDRTKELQKVKAHIALHQVYGVDLNATAVELAEISLWLDTMNADMDAPWYGLHLRHGNALVGATRSLYSPSQLNKRAWLSETPVRKRLDDIAEAVEKADPSPALSDGVHHFLLPSNGWGAPADAKDLKNIVPDEIKAMKSWRSSIRKALTKPQIKKLNNLSLRVEALWRYALLRVQLAETQVSRRTDVWGQEPSIISQAVTRDQIEKDLFGNPDGAYNRLRLVMDAWCAFWYWPLDAVPTEDHPDRPDLPDVDEWLDTLTEILGTDVPTKSKLADHYAIGQSTSWLELNDAERTDVEFSGAKPSSRILYNHPWLETAQSVAKEQGFFHWDLDFAPVFAEGGFDLQVGNPPWVRPRTDLDSLLAESDPWFSLAKKPSQAEKRERQLRLRTDANSTRTVTRGISETTSTAAVLGSPSDYPHLQGQQPDLYRGFMERTWSSASHSGAISLIHPESHFTEKKAAPLRRGTYLRLRRHWQFINELQMFEAHHLVVYGIHIYSSKLDTPQFLNAGHLYHPQTIEESLEHDGSGPLPGIKDDNFNWDRRPHKDRVQIVNLETLEVWKSILEEDSTPTLDARMVYTVNTESAAVLEKLAAAPRVKELGLHFSRGWDESIDKKKGYFDVGWDHPSSWNDVILQGPHLGVSTPMIKQPNPTLKHNQDWSETDLEAMPNDFIPATGYQPNRADNQDYDGDYGTWDIDGQSVPVASTYRIAWRLMAATTGYRTLYPALIPPGAKHIDGVFSAGPISHEPELLSAIGASSIIGDFLIRATGTANLRAPSYENLPLLQSTVLSGRAIEVFLRLNCLTDAYAEIWENFTATKWTSETPYRTALARYRAQSELDVITAITLGISIDELCMLYRTQFPVMRRYDDEDIFDKSGRKLPKVVSKKYLSAGGPNRAAINEYTWEDPESEATFSFEAPFQVFDREKEMRKHYSHYWSIWTEGDD